MKTFIKTTLAAAAALLASTTALADITIGVSLSLTGPASGLGIPIGNQIKLWPTSIAGEKLKVIVLDDATDPTNGVSNAKKFVTEDKVDIIMGSAATPVAIAMADTAATGTTHRFVSRMPYHQRLKIGEKVEIDVPAGTMKFKILEIQYEE